MRRAWRSAQRLGADLDVLWVQPPGRAPDDETERALFALRQLISVLGANLIVRESDDVVEAAAAEIRERGTTYVLVGESPPRRGLGAAARAASRSGSCAPRPRGVDVRIVAARREK